MNLRTKLKDCLRWAQIRCKNRDRPAPQITLAWLQRQWERQGGRCAWTGAKMEMSGPLGVTLDRINPARFYQRDNVVLATMGANRAKGDMTTLEFRRLCRQVLRTHNQRCKSHDQTRVHRL